MVHHPIHNLYPKCLTEKISCLWDNSSRFYCVSVIINYYELVSMTTEFFRVLLLFFSVGLSFTRKTVGSGKYTMFSGMTPIGVQQRFKHMFEIIKSLFNIKSSIHSGDFVGQPVPFITKQFCLFQ